MRKAAGVVLLLITAGAEPGAAEPILVYDDNSVHQLALTAAQATGDVVVRANSGTFGALLTSRSWRMVLVDMPSTTPDQGGFDALRAYIQQGGRVAMSFWTWQSQPSLSASFGVRPLRDISFTNGTTLHDFGTSPVFDGVSMPMSDWHNHWHDDGDVLALTGNGTFIAGISARDQGVMALTNGGRTIAAPLFDEAGDTWLDDGSGVRLWSNMIGVLGDAQAVPEPGTILLLSMAGAAAGLARRKRNPRNVEPGTPGRT